jgi:hypothetical protein
VIVHSASLRPYGLQSVQKLLIPDFYSLCKYVCACVWTCTHVYVSMCVHVQMCVIMCVHSCVHAHVRKHACTYKERGHARRERVQWRHTHEPNWIKARSEWAIVSCTEMDRTQELQCCHIFCLNLTVHVNQLFILVTWQHLTQVWHSLSTSSMKV